MCGQFRVKATVIIEEDNIDVYVPRREPLLIDRDRRRDDEATWGTTTHVARSVSRAVGPSATVVPMRQPAGTGSARRWLRGDS